jgi:hypothetical protein
VCVCVCVCVCVRVCVCVCLHVCLYALLVKWACILVCVHFASCVFKSVCTCVCNYVCVSLVMCAWMCLCLYVFVCLCVDECLCVCVLVLMCLWSAVGCACVCVLGEGGHIEMRRPKGVGIAWSGYANTATARLVVPSCRRVLRHVDECYEHNTLKKRQQNLQKSQECPWVPHLSVSPSWLTCLLILPAPFLTHMSAYSACPLPDSHVCLFCLPLLPASSLCIICLLCIMCRIPSCFLLLACVPASSLWPSSTRVFYSRYTVH